MQTGNDFSKARLLFLRFCCRMGQGRTFYYYHTSDNLSLSLDFYRISSVDPMLMETLQSIRLPVWRNESKSPVMVKKHSSELCKKLHLTSHQRQLCLQGGDGLAEVLLEAIRISASFCQQQFQYDRWNCSLNESLRLPTLQKGTNAHFFY